MKAMHELTIVLRIVSTFAAITPRRRKHCKAARLATYRSTRSSNHAPQRFPQARLWCTRAACDVGECGLESAPRPCWRRALPRDWMTQRDSCTFFSRRAATAGAGRRSRRVPIGAESVKHGPWPRRKPSVVKKQQCCCFASFSNFIRFSLSYGMLACATGGRDACSRRTCALR
jgi:hypothetical protein